MENPPSSQVRLMQVTALVAQVTQRHQPPASAVHHFAVRPQYFRQNFRPFTSGAKSLSLPLLVASWIDTFPISQSDREKCQRDQ